MKKNLLIRFALGMVFLTVTIISLVGCNKSEDTDEPKSNTTVYEFDSKRSYCDPLVINVLAGQKLTITTTDSVITNINGAVMDCDYWTDADGIPDCHYINDIEELHDLPFMALIGKFADDYFLVGTSYAHTFADSGSLELSVNDFGSCGADSDNVGTFVITVRIE